VEAAARELLRLHPQSSGDVPLTVEI
jgi:hypothetical protein